MKTRKWSGYWISNNRLMIAPIDYVESAPLLRKTFECKVLPKQAAVFLCALGWHELYVNGQKADDRVLAPVVTQFDKRVSYIRYDVTKLLKAGKNAVTVWLGNGWYNCHTAEVWSFDKAPWRDWPKLLCDIEADGQIIAKSDRTWLYHDSPILFDALRNGETYDANLEIPGVFSAEFDDREWQHASQANPPGGIVVEEDLEPCRVRQSYLPVAHWALAPDMEVYDFGTNLTGWCQMTLEGEAGAEVVITHSEMVGDQNNLFANRMNTMVLRGEFQTDRYTLKGGGTETFHPHFTYHGFRYACVKFPADKKVKLVAIEAQFIHNDFASMGSFSSSDATLNRLQEITLQSYLCNFTGIPTDCPHREKNGWTGDANIACETGLWNCNAVNAYKHFLRMMADNQRPSGQFPGIVPSGGWGYNWGSGPAWDSMIFEGCYQIYRFTGDGSMIAELYDNMKLYLEYCHSRAEENCLGFGLGDWCHCSRERMVPVEFTSTCYYYSDAVRMAFFAKLLNRNDDAAYFGKLAQEIKQSFTKKFYQESGVWSTGVMTAQAAPLYFGLAEAEAAKTADVLAQIVRSNQYKIDFGFMGAKFVPRVLCDYGYIDEAFRLVTQEEFPGWGYFVKQGATTLWEDWHGKSSRNHVLFADVSAWMFEYLGGVSPDLEAPGFKRVSLHPVFPAALHQVQMTHLTPLGELRVAWVREDGKITYSVELPADCQGSLTAPDGTQCAVAGKQQFSF